MKKKFILIFSLLLFRNYVNAQDSTQLSWSGYIETYYAYSAERNKPKENISFFYNHKRFNELSINLAYIKANYNLKKIRTNLAFMTGGYAQYNLANEATLWQSVFEANIGVLLSQKYNIWVDVGVMPSHIGFESAISQDCWTLTRSIVAENSPYFETGIKLSGNNSKGNLTLAALLLNGWQRVHLPPFFHRPSAGFQINYKYNNKITLNYSNFLGTDKPDSMASFRTYHNFYIIYESENQLNMIIGFDIGTEKTAQQKSIWYTPVCIARIALTPSQRLTFRAEYYADKNQIMLKNNLTHPLDIFGFSLNYDYQIQKDCYFRIEGKYLNANQSVFEAQQNKRNLIVTSSLSKKF